MPATGVCVTRMKGQFVLAAIAALGSAPVFATGVAAGTRISNTVVATYLVAGTPLTSAASNSMTVDQLVDDVVTWQDGGVVAAPGGAVNQSLLFKLTNAGNGSDSFMLAVKPLPASGPDFTATGCRIYLDTDGNGVYSTSDPLYAVGVDDPVLAADASINVLALCGIPATVPDQGQARVELSARSNTFSGTPGKAAPGAGVDGVVAVLGASGGRSKAVGRYLASNVRYTVSISQTLDNPPGAEQPTSGTVILYTLTVKPSGGATGRNLFVHDTIPEHTTYMPGSLALDDVPLGDSVTDGDAGDFDVTNPGAVTVQLGDVPGDAEPLIITFKVTIN